MTAHSDHPRRPLLAFGADPGRFGKIRQPLEIARTSDLLAIDLDLRQTWFPPRSRAFAEVNQTFPHRLRSVWLPSDINGMMIDRRRTDLAELLQAARQHLGLHALIVPRTVDTGERSSVIQKLAREIVNQKIGSLVRLTIGLHAGDFRHDRWHLDQLAGISRMAEEWDLDLALDLTGNISLAWEAEAAILRVFPRLTIVRLDPWRRDDGTLIASQSGQIAGRSLTMLADQRFSGTISLHAPARSTAAASNIIAFEKHDILQRFVSTNVDLPNPIDSPINDFTRQEP